MYVEQRNGKYRYCKTYTDPMTGKQKRAYVTLAKYSPTYKAKAERLLDEKIDNIIGGNDSEITLAAAVTEYLTDNQSAWRPTTHRRNTGACNTMLKVLGAETRLNALTARFVRQRYNLSGRAPSTLNEDLTRFKALIRWCYQNDLIKDIRWLDKLTPWLEHREKNDMKYLERAEIEKLIPELRIDINRMAIQFLILSGLRVGEMLSLNKSDVDTDERVIHVTKTLDPAKGVVLQGAKTYSGNRNVYIQDELLTLVREINRYLLEIDLQSGIRSDFFLHDLMGKPLQYARLNKYFKENTERVLHRRLTIHSLRHTHASLLFEAGMSIDSVSRRLGHSSSRITESVYIHVTKKLEAKYAEQLNAVKMM